VRLTENQPSTDYRIYLLTVWREDEEGPKGTQGLRFRLEDPRTGERRGYSSADALFAFLRANLSGGNSGG
jgi:hypothetical protein